MSFPAYILETLNRYGKVNLGPLGTFILDYSPAKWHVAKQYFEPPQSFLSWTPSDTNLPLSGHHLGPLTSVISGMHDIPYDQAALYCHQQIEKLNRVLNEKELDLNPFGTLIRQNEHDTISFIKNPAFEPLLKFDPVYLPKLYKEPVKDNSFQWWLVLASALFLATLFLLINKLFGSSNDFVINKQVATEITHPAQISLMDANTAPLISDTVFQTKINMDTVDRIATIITGTFCQKGNSVRMKKLIADQGFQLYEEKLQDDCVRLGVLLTINKNFEETLLRIRNTIEPSAWVLTH